MLELLKFDNGKSTKAYRPKKGRVASDLTLLICPKSGEQCKFTKPKIRAIIIISSYYFVIKVTFSSVPLITRPSSITAPS